MLSSHSLAAERRPLSMLYGASAAALAISFHLLTTGDAAGTKIRIGASDLLLPILLPWVGVSWLRGDYQVSAHRVRTLCFWLGALTAVLLSSLIVGRIHMGAWSSWALINKSLGWMILMGYVALGIWLAAAGGEPAVQRFLRLFLIAGWIGSAASLLVFLSVHLGLITGLEGGYYRLRGAFENPNAFGFALVTIALLQAAHRDADRLFPYRLDIAGLGLLFLGVFFSGSRSAWLGAAGGLAGLLLLRRTSVKDLLLAVIVAALLERLLFYAIPLIASVTIGSGSSAVFANMPIWEAAHNYVSREGLAADSGLEHRLLISRQAIELWQTSPMLGIGLGSFFWDQIHGGAAVPGTIHTSMLWILTEMGLVGAIVFVGFFSWILWAAWHTARAGKHPTMAALFAIVVATAAASIGLEILYQRYLWFLLGLAMISAGNSSVPNRSVP